MGRRRKGLPIHGWLVIDKPLEMTSTAVVSAVRRITGAAKVGHGGTLDPLATGILPVALGEATKTVSHVMDGRKLYRMGVRWGEQRDTDDGEGRVIATSEARPTLDQVRAALPAFTGVIDQVPPRFSAVKIDGRRAYDLARADADAPVDLKARPVRIDSITILTSAEEAVASPDRLDLLIAAGKGTYMRSLARDLAAALGTCAYMDSLRRLSCGPFDESHAISLDHLESLGHSAAGSDALLSVETALDDIPALALTDTEARRLAMGQPVALPPLLSRMGDAACGIAQPSAPDAPDERVYKAMSGTRLVAMARIVGGEIRPVRVMNL
ncbi:tRNA pseudouridine(55) synthase TruB [Roseospira marina]|uniref:tRNA pseudouridine synthase B n=1 Tax=Roseospira marina TaxID=140057 RepID=A0A5M6I7E9_9PROT|nr:tRNA pseudouridine(55) synthase TruB [Roseospira marina]KAA5603738.1 tRNA pseudouridine(55) synthase TruB [Roseospira marina]MBB4316074.1 tRNA pseudouridine55 synthase [Roseospira marina]MBB5089208.1 tRNA pseudouridine55 synthase [Roseospira marina]